ncbi:hypothetical protein, partial [Tychonema sp. LEGE 07203]|uniref:hypothetical protein n=1 Tax=Tychonema sp. LEGE 07203 TaxID=1828671 RepID=UPI001D15860B
SACVSNSTCLSICTQNDLANATNRCHRTHLHPHVTVRVRNVGLNIICEPAPTGIMLFNGI